MPAVFPRGMVEFFNRLLSEETTCASRRARFRKGNPGGNDHTPVRDSRHLTRRDFAS